jgi:hypothetical protein
MKSILKSAILFALLFSFSNAEAQTRKTKKEKSEAKKLAKKEALVNARFNKNEKAKKLVRDSVIIKMAIEDSTRLAMDSIGNFQKDSMRVAYRDSGYRAIDSMDKMQYAAHGVERTQWDKTEKFHTDVASTTKLSAYKTRQIKIINQSFSYKARALAKDSDLQSKASELSTLNEERRSQIKAVVGKRKEKIIEKQRKSFIKKNGVDEDMVWIDVAESVVKK